MSRRGKIGALTVLVLIIIGIGFSVIYYISYARSYDDKDKDTNITQQLVIPTEENILQNGYPQNEQGETYGPAVPGKTEPDMVPAIGEDGVKGYVKVSDLTGPLPETSAEALETMEEESGDFTVPLYLQDGITVIGKYIVSHSGTTSEE